MLKFSPATVLAALQLLSACASNVNAPEVAEMHMARVSDVSTATASDVPAVRAEAMLRDVTGREVGTLRLVEDAAGGLTVAVHATGLNPGLHGLHLHAVGVCNAATAPAFASAGGHFNPTGRKHGHHNPDGHHRGDLPNLVANEAGIGRLTTRMEEFSVAELLDADGAALVIHQNEDDLRTDSGPLGPGNSGPRIACGVLEQR